MRRISVYLLIFMFFVLPPKVSPHTSFGRTTISQASSSYIENAISAIEGLASSNWVNLVNPWDDQLYFSVAGGLAGVGIDLLELINYNSYNSTIDADLKVRILSLAERIGVDLLNFAVVNNDTVSMWTVHDNTSSIDLGYDFGLSGIASFYSKLALNTGNTTYTSIAERTLNAVVQLSNTTGGISWTTNLNYFDENIWYGFGDFYHSALENATYTGKAFGSTGLGMAALDYLSAPGSNVTFALSTLDGVLEFLNSSKVIIDNYSAFPIILSRPDVISNSLSFGMAGIGEFLHEYQLHLNSSLVNETIVDVINWFFSNTSDGQHTYLSSTVSSTLTFNGFWVGKDLGIAGNLKFLVEVFDLLSERQQDEVKQLSTYLSLFAKEKSGGLVFPERVENNIPFDYSPVNAYGTSGIVEVLLDVSPALNQSNIINLLEQYRVGIVLASKNITYGLYYELMGDYGFASAVGLSGVLKIFVPEAIANIRFSTSSVDFGEFPLGEPATYEVILTNKGTVGAIISLVNLTYPLSSNLSQNIILNPDERISVLFAANPMNESGFFAFATFSIDDQSFFTVQFSGRAVDSPVVELLSPKNGSTLKERTTLQFKVTDSSSIKSVKMTIKNGETVVSQNDLTNNGDIYSFDWDIKKWINGTFTVIVTATDVNDFSTTKQYSFTVLNIVGKPTDFFGSDTFFYAMLGLVGFAIAIAVFLTIKIRRAS